MEDIVMELSSDSNDDNYFPQVSLAVQQEKYSAISSSTDHDMDGVPGPSGLSKRGRNVKANEDHVSPGPSGLGKRTRPSPKDDALIHRAVHSEEYLAAMKPVYVDEVTAGPSGLCSPGKPAGDPGSEKLSKAAEREAKKKMMAESKAAKKTLEEVTKIYKPGECMKYMTVEAHPTLWSSWWWTEVCREMTATGAKLVQAPQLCHPSLVVWSRTLPRSIDKDSGQLKLTPSTEPCSHALYISSVEDIAEYVHHHKLATHLAEIKVLADCQLTLVLFGYNEYFNAPRRQTLNSNRTPMTDIELELALTDLMVSAQCDSAVVNTPNELALFLAMQTKAIAEAPYKRNKRACDEQAQFYMRGDSRQCVAMDKNGVGVSRVWQQMLAVLPNSSLETARSLCAQYKSPLALFEALQTPNTVSEIADIGVSRAAVPGSKARRIGPEFAKKLKILFTADDGSTLVN